MSIWKTIYILRIDGGNSPLIRTPAMASSDTTTNDTTYIPPWIANGPGYRVIIPAPAPSSSTSSEAPKLKLADKRRTMKPYGKNMRGPHMKEDERLATLMQDPYVDTTRIADAHVYCGACGRKVMLDGRYGKYYLSSWNRHKKRCLKIERLPTIIEYIDERQ